jgi:ApaG protein
MTTAADNTRTRRPAARTGSDVTSEGVRVQVTPGFLPDHSDPAQDRFVFGYRIRITNQGDRRIKLVSRHWDIVDADGDKQTADGEGVVGQQPELAPGESFEYASHCQLQTPWGTMEGTYTFLQRSGETPGLQFAARIGRFYLVSNLDAAGRH